MATVEPDYAYTRDASTEKQALADFYPVPSARDDTVAAAGRLDALPRRGGAPTALD